MMNDTEYAAKKTEYAAITAEHHSALRAFHAMDILSDKAAWSAARLACNELERRVRTLAHAFLSDPDIRWGDWRTTADREVMRLLGWNGYRANCAMWLRAA